MKVALVDNMNNNFFAVARYFRDLGIDAHLYLIPGSRYTHFDPQQDTFCDLRHIDWIKLFPMDYSWHSILRLIFNKERMNVFSEYDYVISCGLAVGLLNKSGINTDVFIPYGSDLYNSPFFQFPPMHNLVQYIPGLLLNYLISQMQSEGIKKSKIIISNSNWLHAENAVNALGKKSTNLPRIMVYLEKNASIIRDTWKFMDASDFVVYSPTRHLWKTNADVMPDFSINGGMKRNDKLIRAFSQIVKDRIYKNPLLVLFDYGPDIAYSKELIKELNISANIIWMPLMARKFLLQGMTKATFVADQFRESMSATSAGITNEALAVGVPVIANTDGAIFDPTDPYYGAPILQALTELEIYNYFVDYYKHPDKYKAFGSLGKKWFADNLGTGLAKKYLELLNDL